jgi:hypothetical protein
MRNHRTDSHKASRSLFLTACAISALASLSAAPANAQVGRLYLNVPEDSDLTIVTYNGVRSNTGLDESLATEEIISRSQTGTFAYAHVMSIFGKSGGPGFALPVSSILSYDETTNQVTQNASGIGDLSLTFDVNLFGAPSLDQEAFAAHVPTDYAGLHFTATLPTGQYDPQRTTNLGANRFSYKAVLNYSLTGDGGKTWIDTYTSVRFFGDNDRFQGNKRLSQSALFGFEAHVSRNVARNAWLSIGGIAGVGGSTRVDDLAAAPSQGVVRGALGGGFSAWPGGAVIVGYNHTLIRGEGDPRADSFMLQFLHRFR